MKFTYHTIKSGILYFLFTPALMTITAILAFTKIINGDTEVPSIITLAIINRYSAESFFLTVFIFFAISLTIIAVIKTQNFPHHEKIRLALFFNFSGSFLSKKFLFWAGALIALSAGSQLVDFIPPAPELALASIIFIFSAIAVRFGCVKFKHYLLKPNLTHQRLSI